GPAVRPVATDAVATRLHLGRLTGTDGHRRADVWRDSQIGAASRRHPHDQRGPPRGAATAPTTTIFHPTHTIWVAPRRPHLHGLKVRADPDTVRPCAARPAAPANNVKRQT